MKNVVQVCVQLSCIGHSRLWHSGGRRNNNNGEFVVVTTAVAALCTSPAPAAAVPHTTHNKLGKLGKTEGAKAVFGGCTCQ